ncbi:MAG TPA: subclass B3 metallo-beta-lactamase, partial [Thermoanaerobaculia bacterium]|nr:subclass B3 metallo-beta-lactamase [Thermoanaerobaculia bacterium]
AAFAAPARPLSPEEQKWNEPIEPFRIAGNLYYVGARDVTSYLVATPAGHVVIDSGFAETVPQVLANIRTLGFRPEDVEWLLISHPHYDHVGGIADLRDATGAEIAVSAADADQAARGGVGDFAFGDRFRYRPFTADRLLRDGDTVALGGSVLTANVTPGHTRGCTSWTMDVVEGGKPLHVVFVCSITAPGYQLATNDGYPRIADDYRETFRRLAAMPVDVFLAAHGSFFGLVEKRAALCRNPERNPFVDPEGYREHLERLHQQFEQKLSEQGGS